MEAQLLARVEIAAREAAREVFDSLEDLVKGDLLEEEAVEAASMEVATAEYGKHVGQTDESSSESKLKTRMEAAGKEAGRRELARLKAETEVAKTKEDLAKKIKAQVEEAARQAAREKYASKRAEEDEALEGAEKKKDTDKEDNLQAEVEKAGVTAAQSEFDKVRGEAGEDDTKDREEAGRIGKTAALVEYERLTTEEAEQKANRKEIMKREAKLLEEVETAAKEAARELFERIIDGACDEEETAVEHVGIAAAVAEYAKHEMEEDKELKEKLETAGMKAAKSEYAKLKSEDETRDVESPDIMFEKEFNAELEEVASEAARATYEKITADEVERENLDAPDSTTEEDILKTEVTNSGVAAAMFEFDNLTCAEEMEQDTAEDSTQQETLLDSEAVQTSDNVADPELDTSEELIDHEKETRKEIEDAGRAAAEEEYNRLKTEEEKRKRAAKELADKQAELLTGVKKAAKKAAKDIFTMLSKAGEQQPESTKSHDEEQMLLMEAGLQAAESEYMKYKSDDSEKNIEDSLISANDITSEQLKAKMELASKKAAQEEFARLKAQARKKEATKQLLEGIEDAVKKQVRAIIDEFQSEGEVFDFNKAFDEVRGIFEAAGAEAAEDVFIKLNEESSELSADIELQDAVVSGKQFALDEFNRLRSEQREADLLAGVKNAAKMAATDIFTMLNKAAEEDPEYTKPYDEEQRLVEEAGLQAAQSEYIKYKYNDSEKTEEDPQILSNDITSEQLKAKMELAGSQAAQDEFARLKSTKQLLEALKVAVKKQVRAIVDDLQSEGEVFDFDKGFNEVRGIFESAGAEAAECVWRKLNEESTELSGVVSADIELEEAVVTGRQFALDEFDRLRSEQREASLLKAVRAAAKEAAMQVFVNRDTLEKLAASESAGEHEENAICFAVDAIENAGASAAAEECAKYTDDTNSNEFIRLKTKMELVGKEAVKEEFSRLVAEAENIEKENRFKDQVEEAARWAAKAVFAMMISEEQEANNGNYIEDFDGERDKVFETEIASAGAEAALAEFAEFLRAEERNSGDTIKEDTATETDIEDADKEEVEILGKEAAIKEYTLLKAEMEVKVKESRLRAEAEADRVAGEEEAARRKIEEDERRAEEQRLLEEEEQRRVEEEEQRRIEEKERLRKEQEDLERLRKEEAERLRLEEERLRLKEEERLKKEEEERLRSEEEERRKKEEEERLQREEEEERLRAEEEERCKKEEEDRLLREEEERLKRVEEEKLRKEEEERRRKEYEEKLRREEEERKIREEEERIRREEEERMSRLLAGVEKAARDAAREIYDRLEAVEVGMVETVSLQVANAEYEKHVEGSPAPELVDCPLKTRMEATGRWAGMDEFARLKAEAEAERRRRDEEERLQLEEKALAELRERQRKQQAAWMAFILASIALYWALR